MAVEESSTLARRLKLLLVASAIVGLGAIVLTFKAYQPALAPRILPSARNMRPRADAPTVPRATGVQPRADGPVVSTSYAPPERGVDAGVDGDGFVRDLVHGASLTEQEEERIRKFLGLIARTQLKLAALNDSARRRDLEERLQQQALNGIRIRVAVEKREQVTALLASGVPRLAFTNPAAP